jgi:hypothetical protein
MTFFSGNYNNAQWVALSLYGVNIIYSGIRAKKSNEYEKVKYWARVILCIAAIAAYYIARVIKFPDGNDDLNTIYFIASILLLFFGSL